MKNLIILFLLLTFLALSAFAADPIATNKSATVFNIGATSLQLQGSDADGTALVFAIVGSPAHGTISQLNTTTGALLYTPTSAYVGTDSFTFKVTSGGADSNTATVSVSVTNQKTRIIDYLLNPDSTPRAGTVTFILTQQANSPGGLIAANSSVSAVLSNTGKFDLSLYPSVSLSPQSYYQVWFAQSGSTQRTLIGLYAIPASTVAITLAPYRVTNTNLNAIYNFIGWNEAQAITQNAANAATNALLGGQTDQKLQKWDDGDGTFKDAKIEETNDGVTVDGRVTADGYDGLADADLPSTQNNKTLTGAVNINATTLGFYGVTPIVRPSSPPVTSGASVAELETDLNELKAILNNLGLLGGPSSLLTNLAAYWKLQPNVANTTWPETSGSGYTLTQTNGLPTIAAGRSLQSVALAGTGSPSQRQTYLTTSHASALAMGSGSFTVSMWIYLDTDVDAGLLEKSDGSNQDYFLLYQTALKKVRWRIYAGGTPYTVDSATISTKTWTHILAYYNHSNNTIGIYTNNSGLVSTSTSGSPNGYGGPLNLGIMGGYVWNGRIDELAIWSRVLTSDERASLYNSGNGATYTFSGAAPAAGAIAITTPAPYQVVQRTGTAANIAISGTYTGSPTAIQCSFNGGAYQTVAGSPANGVFSGVLTSQSQGQGSLTCRFTNNTAISYSQPYVGIGDVFIVAGQSNASGRATNNQTYSHGSLKVSVFDNSGRWREITDPTDSNSQQLDSVSSDTATGSIWPLVATSHAADQSVPVAFVPCAKGGTTVLQWQPGADHLDRTTLYGSCNYRMQQAGSAAYDVAPKAKAWLWWQGEQDAFASTSTSDYQTRLQALADAVYTDGNGAFLMPNKLQGGNDYNGTQQGNINTAIGNIWSSSHLKPLADLSDLTTTSGDHFFTNGELATISTRVWNAIKAAFF